MSGASARLAAVAGYSTIPKGRTLLTHLLHALNQPLTGLHCSLELALAGVRSTEQYCLHAAAIGLDGKRNRSNHPKISTFLHGYRLELIGRSEQQPIKEERSNLFGQRRLLLGQLAQGLDQQPHPGGKFERLAQGANILFRASHSR